MSNAKTHMGILGGSFDPIHFGHIKPCIELAEQFQLDTVKFLPCKVSPFKDTTFTSVQHRWNMISMITGSSDLFHADARELERDAPSYTYESLKEISQEVSQDMSASTKLFWIMGEDALHEFPDWHQAEKIMQLCHVLVMRRPGVKANLDERVSEWLSDYISDDVSQLDKADYGHIYITDTETFDISSTQIREILQSGQQPQYLLPGSVWNYIKRNRLYQKADILKQTV